jgi:uncharacterized membrane protein YvbJ
MTDSLECPNCGKINPYDVSNCLGCNLSVSVFDVIAKKKEKEPIVCSNCDHKNPGSLSVCEECGERIERLPKRIEEKKEKKEMSRTQQILLITVAILLFPLVIIGGILYFIINAITGISKGRAAIDELDVEAFSELEKGSRER